MQASIRSVPLDEVVTALTGVEADGTLPSVEEQTARAAQLFDPKQADEACEMLLEACAAEPVDARNLEALVVLALAYPELVEKHGLQVGHDGLRLAELLEEEGDEARAGDLLAAIEARAARKSGAEDLEAVLEKSAAQHELVERHLERAKDAARFGKTKEAITWLREALLVDRSRADIARMIRDLRYAQTERRARWRMRARKALSILVLGGLVYFASWRETWIEQQFYQVPMAREGDEVSVRARIQGLDDLLATHFVWLGALSARRELADLRMQLGRIEQRRRVEAVHVQEKEAQRLYALDSAYVLGRTCAEAGDYAGALAAFREALQHGPDAQLRERLEGDIKALEGWLAAHAGPPGAPQEVQR